MAEKVEELNEKYKKVMKLSMDKRKENERIEKFQDMMKSTMPLWPRDALKRMEETKKGLNDKEKESIEYDIKFLKSMMSDRIASFHGKDENTAKSLKKRVERKQREDNKTVKEKHHIEETLHNFTSVVPSDVLVCDEDTDYELPTTSRSHKRTVKVGTGDLFCPHDILKSPIVVSSSVRNGITPTQLSSTVHSVIEAMSGDTSRVNLHPTQSLRCVSRGFTSYL